MQERRNGRTGRDLSRRVSMRCIVHYINRFIVKETLLESAKNSKGPYGEHLNAVAEGKVRY